MAPAVRNKPDHLAYYYGFDMVKEDVLRVFQLYSNQSASAVFLNHPDYIAYLAEVEERLVQPPEIFQTAPVCLRHYNGQ